MTEFVQPPDLLLCKECGKPIRRYFAGSIETFGHLVNPAADHHYARPARTFADRFWDKVDKAGPVPAGRPDLGPCWLWTGSKDRDGYGDIRTSGTGHRSAHRYAYTVLVGVIPGGLSLDHLCRVHACVNPDHLEPVTNRENILRGTAPSAENARKTACPAGHELAGENLLALSRGGRSCKACHRDKMKARGAQRATYMRDYRARKRATPRTASDLGAGTAVARRPLEAPAVPPAARASIAPALRPAADFVAGISSGPAETAADPIAGAVR